MEFLERVRWTSGTPDIRVNYYYEYQRSGADMQYRLKIVIEPVTGARSFGYYINSDITLENTLVASVQIKANSPSQWSNNIEWTSGWWTVSNKTSGTSAISIRLFSNSGRDQTNSYSLYVAPAYASCSQSLKSKTETSITMNWSSDNTCDYLWYSKDNGANWTAVGSINATSGSYTISGLTANAPYNIKTRIRRKDSQLTTDSSVLYVPTYNYPFAETVPNFNIESSVTIGIYNPLGRSCNVTIYGADGSTIKTLTTSSTSTGAILNDQTSITNLYNSIPNAKSGNYKVRVVYGSSTKDNSNGVYTAVQSLCNPTFSDFRFFDDDYDVTDLTGDNQIIVPRYSDVAVIVSEANKAEARKGATMSKYQIKIGTETKDITYSSQMGVSGVIDNAPSGTVQVYAIDSRGYTTEVVKTASVIKNYTDIQRGSISIARQNNVGEAVTLAFNGTYWGESFGSVTNSITNVTYRYKKTTEGETGWVDGTTSITPTESNNTYSFNGGIVGDIVGTGFDAAYSYNIEVTVYDELSSTTFTATLGSGSPNMAFVDGGVSFLGKYDENDTTNKFQINGNTKISGNETITGSLSATSDINSGGVLKEKNMQITPIDINATTSTILSRVKSLGSSGIKEATWFTATDGGTSGISDKPTGSTNAGFVCNAICNRYASSSDYRYVLTAYVQADTTEYVAVVTSASTTISWVKRTIPTATSQLNNDSFKFRKFEKSMTIGANGMASIDMGAVNVPSGYSYLGTLPIHCGFADQWVVSFSNYDNNHIIATGHSKYGVSLTHNVSCYAVYIKDTVKSQMIL